MDLSKLSKPNQDNLLKFWNWMTQTGRARIYRFDVSSVELYKLLAYEPIGVFEKSMHQSMSDLIDSYLDISPEKVQHFIKHSEPNEWYAHNSDLYICYRMLKLLWLCEDVKGNGIQAPMQLIQHGRQYRSHPGSDKKFALTFLDQHHNVPMFYIWYPELDPAPWIWTIPHQEVKTPAEFCEMFVNVFHTSFDIKYCDVTFTNDDIDFNNDHHFHPWAEGALAACKKYGKVKEGAKFNLTLPTLSYTDGVHRAGGHADIEHVMKKIRHQDGIFHFGDYKFVHYNNLWVLDRYLNLPTSLVDTDWCWDESRAIYFDNKKPNISRYRMDM